MDAETDHDWARETSTYWEVLSHLSPKFDGWYVAVVDTHLVGMFESAGDAWRAGLAADQELRGPEVYPRVYIWLVTDDGFVNMGLARMGPQVAQA